MRIKKIKIENIRGIQTREILLDIHPNTPTFFVAPNGFGKTSIATAFKSLNNNRIDIDEQNKYQNDESSIPYISITDDTDTTYYANNLENTISNQFSVFVINSQVKPKASMRNLGSFSSSTPSLIVEPIVLCKRIPEKQELEYSFTEMKKRFGVSAGKLLINLHEQLKIPSFVNAVSSEKNDLAKLLQTRNQSIITSFLIEVNKIQGTAETISMAQVDATAVLGINAYSDIENCFSFLLSDCSPLAKELNIIQLSYLFEQNQGIISKAEKYYSFLAEKREINSMLSFFNCTWKDIKVSKKGNQYILDFPKADQISNGERDILCFIGKLIESRKALRKDKSILVVDEIFDYLDDANLISAQYFITKLIAQFKLQGKELFPIILTHLDPMYFNTYSFSTKNVVYLDRITIINNKYKINNLLKEREKCKKTDKELYNRISSNYLHFSTDNTNDSNYLSSIGVGVELQTPESFREKAFEELENYRNHSNYDLALVCCGLRLYIEKSAYEKLAPQNQQEFLSAKKTTIDKLTFAKENGAIIPEVHFLLSIIYNEAMHLDPQCQRLHPIACKLRNKVIKNMICEL